MVHQQSPCFCALARRSAAVHRLMTQRRPTHLAHSMAVDCHRQILAMADIEHGDAHVADRPPAPRSAQFGARQRPLQAPAHRPRRCREMILREELPVRCTTAAARCQLVPCAVNFELTEDRESSPGCAAAAPGRCGTTVLRRRDHPVATVSAHSGKALND